MLQYQMAPKDTMTKGQKLTGLQQLLSHVLERNSEVLYKRASISLYFFAQVVEYKKSTHSSLT